MAEYKVKIKTSIATWLRRTGGILLVCALLAACASPKQAVVRKDYLKENVRENPQVSELMKESEPVETPDFNPVTEDISPFKTRLVDIVARNTPLGDVLHVIAEAAGLNLLIENDVALDHPITMTLKKVTAEAALNSIFSSIDYSYIINDNILTVQGITTRIFELGHPAIVQNYSIDVGGDILGSANNLNSSGSSSSGSGSGSSGGSGASTIKGNVSKSGKSDITAFSFWDSLEKSLQNLIRKREAGPAPEREPKTAGISEQDQSVVINRLTGTIAITGTKKNIEKAERFLETVKKVLNRQVLVEARIIEVELSDHLSYGVDWSFLDNFKQIGGTFATGFGSLNIPTRSFSSAVEATVPNFRIGTSRANFQTLITALKEQGNVQTLSNPRINVMNGQTALLSVGRNVSFISKVSSTSTTAAGSAPVTTFSVDTSSVLSGILIGLVPFINEHGEISLTVTPIVSDLVSLKDRNIGQGDNMTTISLPTVDLKELSTSVKVRNGQMVVIGGLISKKDSVTDSKVPILGDIPWLGLLFTRKVVEEQRREMVVVLQPMLIQ